jgi:addiction module HigA family antidote
MSRQKLAPIHPGEILLEEYLVPLQISQNKLARSLGVTAQRVSEIIKKHRAITVDTALRLAKYFKTTPQFWLNLQIHYDLEVAKENKLFDRINREVRETEIDRVGSAMTCHVDTRAAAQSVIWKKGINEFSVPEVLGEMQRQGTLNRYSVSTVRTHITSRCCANAPDNHAVTYNYFRRIRHGVYEVI